MEQIIRPTGLMDPEVDIRPCQGQVDDLMEEVRQRAERGERVLVTTLTKRMAEELTAYYKSVGIRVEYLHSDIDTIERIQIIKALRQGEFDCLVGINLLREGLDIPEVSLVAILDADKEGFLRSERSLIQTMGRAARNAEGRVILYADRKTDSMKKAIAETTRRRKKQAAYNEKNGITPSTIQSAIKDVLASIYERDYYTVDADRVEEGDSEYLDPQAVPRLISQLEKQMQRKASQLEFEDAAKLRDRIDYLRNLRPGQAVEAGMLRLEEKTSQKIMKRGSVKKKKSGNAHYSRGGSVPRNRRGGSR